MWTGHGHLVCLHAGPFLYRLVSAEIEERKRMDRLEVDKSTAMYANPMVAGAARKMGGSGDKNVLNPRTALIQRLSFPSVIGLRGTVYLCLLLSVAGFHFTIFFILTASGSTAFSRPDREYVWVFLLLSTLFTFCTLGALLPCYWRTIADKLYNKRGVRKQLASRRKKNVLRRLYAVYKNNLGLNGKFYLWKLYLFEYMENYVSVYNMETIFLCTLPHNVCILLMSALVLESAYRAYSMVVSLWKGVGVTKAKRDLQITVDIVVDLTFLIFPLGMCVVYETPVTPREILQITLLPSILLLSKLHKMLQETMVDHMDEIASSIENKLSQKRNRRRISLFGNSRSGAVEAKQNKNFPKWAKVGVFSLSVIYVLVMIVIVGVQLARVTQVDRTCECFVDPDPFCAEKKGARNTSLGSSKQMATSLFTTGCLVKTPFCSSLFTPTCDCAVFELHNHNLETLSARFVEMTALRRVVLNRGALRVLPKNMEQLTEMSLFDVSLNRLTKFNVNVEKWDMLTQLKLRYNNITVVHPNVWKHHTIDVLHVNSNKGLEMPNAEGEIYMPNLYNLDITNNSGWLPNKLGPGELPRLGLIDFSGNFPRDGKLPKEFDKLSNSVWSLSIARVGLSILPEFLTTFKRLKYLDARNNSIANISKGISDYFTVQESRGTGFNIFLSGNPGCVDTGSLPLPACAPICSDYCQIESYVGDGFCHLACDSQECEFDGGDC